MLAAVNIQALQACQSGKAVREAGKLEAISQVQLFQAAQVAKAGRQAFDLQPKADVQML